MNEKGGEMENEDCVTVAVSRRRRKKYSWESVARDSIGWGCGVTS